MKTLLALPIFLVLLLPLHVFAFNPNSTPTKIVTIPGENTGETFKLKVINQIHQLPSTEMYYYEALPELQTIETTQIKIELTEGSEIIFDKNGIFNSFRKIKGSLKSQPLLPNAVVNTISIYNYFKIRTAHTAGYLAIFPKNSSSFLFFGEMTFTEDGTLKELDYHPPFYSDSAARNAESQKYLQYFPTIFGQTLMPEGWGIDDVRLKLGLDVKGNINDIYGYAFCGKHDMRDRGYVYRSTFPEPIKISDKLESQFVSLWNKSTTRDDDMSEVRLLLDENLNITAAHLPDIEINVNGSIEEFDMLYRGRLFRGDGYFNVISLYENTPYGKRILAPVSQQSLVQLCRALGNPIPENYKFETSFFKIKFFDSNRTLEKKEVFYDIESKKDVLYRRGQKVRTLNTIFCPAIMGSISL
jgi:hypothetical protein